jgi:hypothetical protein
MCEANDVNAPANDQGAICGDCATVLGIIPMPPPRRPAVPCRHCNGLQFVRVIPREFWATGSGGDHASFSYHVSPMGLTYTFEAKDKWIFKGKNVHPPLARHLRGLLETYVCWQCGHVEWFCNDPTQIPIGPEFMADLIDYSPKEPYR